MQRHSLVRSSLIVVVLSDCSLGVQSKFSWQCDSCSLVPHPAMSLCYRSLLTLRSDSELFFFFHLLGPHCRFFALKSQLTDQRCVRAVPAARERLFQTAGVLCWAWGLSMPNDFGRNPTIILDRNSVVGDGHQIRYIW